MSVEQKRVELTEAERVRIVSASASRRLIIDVVTRIVAAQIRTALRGGE